MKKPIENTTRKNIENTHRNNNIEENHNDQEGNKTKQKSVRFAAQRRTRRIRRRGKNKGGKEELRIMYTNANGITGKAKSLAAALETQETHIAAIVETKLESIPPHIKGYKWINKNRNQRTGGGVALLIRDDITSQIKEINSTEDYDQEIVWIQTKNKSKRLSIGTFYGLQEKEKREEIQRQYAQLTAQILKLKQEGEAILTGDFNSKLQVHKEQVQQEISQNGKEMEKMMDTTGMIAVSLQATKGNWTRVNRNNPQEKSIIDYVLMTPGIAKNTTEIIIDEEGTMRLKGKKESDHNTITITTRVTKTTEQGKKKIWKLSNEEGWKKFNMEMKKKNESIRNYQQLETAIITTLENTIGSKVITIGKYKERSNPIVKTAREEKKKARREFSEACRNNRDDKQEKLGTYLRKQRELREKIEQQHQTNTERAIQQIIDEGGKKSQNFWKKS